MRFPFGVNWRRGREERREEDSAEVATGRCFKPMLKREGRGKIFRLSTSSSAFDGQRKLEALSFLAVARKGRKDGTAVEISGRSCQIEREKSFC